MPQLLREIKKGHWIREPGAPLPAAALRDMSPDAYGHISIWVLPDPATAEFEPFLHRVVVALTLNSRHCEKFEYALADAQAIPDLGLTATESPGNTVDPEVNKAHRDIEDPGAITLAALTARFVPQDMLREREVGRMIADAVIAGRTPRAALPHDIVRKLELWQYL